MDAKVNPCAQMDLLEEIYGFVPRQKQKEKESTNARRTDAICTDQLSQRD